MDLVNSFLNLTAPPFTFFTLLLFLPPWIFFKFCLGILRTVFPEDVSGKVVLITGASSGIGEFYQQRSVNQVREAAKQLRISDLKPPISSDPLASSTLSLTSKLNRSNPYKSLPEKYEMLNTFFVRLGSSIRPLELKRSMTTFTNISRMIESLTDRKFSYSHLAQLKFILPEAIEIKKILVRDDRTSCMKSDLDVTLD